MPEPATKTQSDELVMIKGDAWDIRTEKKDTCNHVPTKLPPHQPPGIVDSVYLSMSQLEGPNNIAGPGGDGCHD